MVPVEELFTDWLATDGVIDRAISTRGLFDMASSREGFLAGYLAAMPGLGSASSSVVDWLRAQGIDPQVLRDPSRKPDAVQIRRRVAHRLDQEGWSPARIGRLIGRDRTTVLHLLGRKG